MTARVHFCYAAGNGIGCSSCSLGSWPRVRAQLEAGDVLIIGGSAHLEGSLV